MNRSTQKWQFILEKLACLPCSREAMKAVATLLEHSRTAWLIWNFPSGIQPRTTAATAAKKPTTVAWTWSRNTQRHFSFHVLHKIQAFLREHPGLWSFTGAWETLNITSLWWYCNSMVIVQVPRFTAGGKGLEPSRSVWFWHCTTPVEKTRNEKQWKQAKATNVWLPALVPGCQWLGSTSLWESPSYQHLPKRKSKVGRTKQLGRDAHVFPSTFTWTLANSEYQYKY